jgi:hypothetical protein
MKMFEIKPWDDKSQEIFQELSMFRICKIKDRTINKSYSRRREILNLTDNDLLGIWGNRRKKESCFTIPKDVNVFPKFTKKGMIFKFEKKL